MKFTNNFLVITDNKIDYSINMTYVEQVVLNTDVMPRRPDEEDRKNYKFHPEDYRDAVVMPWYRNTDQPQFFYVAEVYASLFAFVIHNYNIQCL